jgi:hypothetical protein
VSSATAFPEQQPGTTSEAVIEQARRRQRRRRRWLAALAAAGLGVAAAVYLLAGRGSGPPVARPSATATGNAASDSGPIYAIVSPNHGTPVRLANGSYTTLPPQASLVRVDPRTLRPLAGRLGLGRFWGGGGDTSPDGRSAVLLTGKGGLRFLDLAHFRLGPAMTLIAGGGADVHDVRWVGNQRLVAVVQRQSLPYLSHVVSRQLVLIDAGRPAVLAHTTVTHTLADAGSAAANGRFALLLAPSSHSGRHFELLVVEPSGSVRSRWIDLGADHGAPRNPSLAIEPSGQRAFVVGSGTRIAVVDLVSMRVAYKDIRFAGARPTSSPGFVNYWATMAGPGHLAVSGNVSTPDQSLVLGSGAYLVDTHTWKSTLLDRSASSATYADGVVITSGAAVEHEGQTVAEPVGVGISAFTLTGARLYHILGRQTMLILQIVRGRVFAVRFYGGPLLNPPRVTFDLDTGRHVGRLPALSYGLTLLN